MLSPILILIFSITAGVVMAVGAVVATLLITMPIAKNVYNEQLVRTSPDKWKRENSCPTDAEYSAMYREAEEWGEQNQ